MARKLNSSLIEKLKTGSFCHILKCVIDDPKLSFEIRISSTAIIYYHKSKILSIHSRKAQPTLLAEGYYKDLPMPILDLEDPKPYFKLAKCLVDKHTSSIKDNKEFEIQQKIVAANKSDKNKYLIVDMEYQFEQGKIKERTKNKTRFDLVAINLKENQIVFMELKQGTSSSSGKSGVIDHHNRYLENINHSEFKKALIDDIKAIILQKQELGIFKLESTFFTNLLDKAELIFKVVYAYEKESDFKNYKSKFGDRFYNIYIDQNNPPFILKDN